MEITHPPIQTFEEFWPFYLSQHQNKTSRILHYLGTIIGILCISYISATHQPWPLVFLSLIPSYFCAWLGHFAFEKNVPATFTYPMWSLKADFKMLYCFISGKLEAELQK